MHLARQRNARVPIDATGAGRTRSCLDILSMLKKGAGVSAATSDVAKLIKARSPPRRARLRGSWVDVGDGWKARPAGPNDNRKALRVWNLPWMAPRLFALFVAQYQPRPVACKALKRQHGARHTRSFNLFLRGTATHKPDEIHRRALHE